ncbi:hypothetical protein [Clostridium sp. CTA-1]
MNDIDVYDIIKKAINEAIREYDREKIMSYKDKRLHNTRLLMKNYNKLSSHIDDVKANVEFEILENEDKVWLTSIARTKLRTMKMMAHIYSALKILKKRFKKECMEYKYKAFELYYIEEKTNEEIMDFLKCGKNQPKIWSELVLNELSILLWGVEALGM